MGMRRRAFLTGAIGALASFAGCITDSAGGANQTTNGQTEATDSPSSTATEATDSPSPTATEAPPTETSSTSPQAPAVCADGIRFESLSSSSQEEFETALTEDGLTRSTLNFSIVNETRNDDGLDTINDEVGSEMCILYEGTYYFGTVGLGIPVTSSQENGSNEYQYRLQFERAKRYNTVIETSSD